MRNSCQSAIQNAAVRILSTSVLVRPAPKQRRDFMKTAVGQQRRNVFCPDSSKKSQFSTSNSEEPGISIRRLPAFRGQIPIPQHTNPETGAAPETSGIPQEAFVGCTMLGNSPSITCGLNELETQTVCLLSRRLTCHTLRGIDAFCRV